mgnify:CR=1 FL=1
MRPREGTPEIARERTKRTCDEQSRLTRRSVSPQTVWRLLHTVPIFLRSDHPKARSPRLVSRRSARRPLHATPARHADHYVGRRSPSETKIRRAHPSCRAEDTRGRVHARASHAHPSGIRRKRPPRSPVVAATEAMATALARRAFGAHASTSASATSALSTLVKRFGASRGFHGASGSLAKAKKGAAAAPEERAHTHSATVATGINIKKGGSDPELGADDVGCAAVGDFKGAKCDFWARHPEPAPAIELAPAWPSLRPYLVVCLAAPATELALAVTAVWLPAWPSPLQ